MRAGWTPRLQELLQRADPAAGPIVEAVVTSAEDVRRRKDQWDRVSATGDVLSLPSGGLRLREVVSGGYISQTERNDWLTHLNPSSVMNTARLRWPSPRTSPVTRIRAWLHPRMDGGLDQEVAYWECRVFWLMRTARREVGGGTFLSLGEAGRKRVAAGGNEGEVTFDFDSLTLGWPTPDDATGTAPYPNPVAYVTIAALQADGSPASNVGWAVYSERTEETQGPGITLNGWTIAQVEEGDPGADQFLGWWQDGAAPTAVPYIVVEHADYTEATATFDGPDRIDLGAVPGVGEVVEFVAQGESPGGSSLTYEVLADDGLTWVPVEDGQTTDDLEGVSVRQIYAMRVRLTPNPRGDVTPTVRNLGVRAVRRWTLTGLADVQLTNSWGFDPRSLRGTIPTARITIIRDGSRDLRDFATELLSDRSPADIEFRIWIGSERLPRSIWLLVDTFELEDYDPQDSAIHIDCVHPAARLRVARLPVFDDGAFGPHRRPLEYSNDQLADVYDDLLAGQIALPERYRGAGIPAGGELVGKVITDSEGKTELDAIAYLAGGVVIASQGQIRFRDVASPGEIAAVFPSEEIELASATPGLRQAVPEFFVDYDWAEEEARFRGEVRAFHTQALDSVRAGRLDAPDRLDTEIARWIATDAHAEAIGARHVGWFGTGLIMLHWRSVYPHPHLEPGDVVLVETHKFVARDPNTARALRGVLWAQAVVSEVRDVEGREFVGWVQSYADLLATSQAMIRISGQPALTNFREIERTETTITYGWERHPLVDTVWIYDLLHEHPLSFDPWPNVERPSPPTEVLGQGWDTYTVEIPPHRHLRYLQVEPRTSGLRAGDVRRAIIQPPPAEPPVIELDDIETATTGTQWIRFHYLGIAVTNLRVLTLTGHGFLPSVSFRDPDRGPGDPSVVKGGTLGPGDYEIDVVLDGDRLSWALAQATLENGAVMTIGPFAFDRNSLPKVLSVVVDGKTARCAGDSDTESWRAHRTDVDHNDPGYWEQRLDGSHVEFEVPVPDDKSWPIRFCAYNRPVANQDDQDPGVAADCVDRTVSGPDAAAAAPRITVDAMAPPPGSFTMSYTLKASDSPQGYTAKIYARRDLGSGFTPYEEIRSLSSLPTDEVEYTLVTVRHRADHGDEKVTYEIKADVLDATDAVVFSRESRATWYTSESDDPMEEV